MAVIVPKTIEIGKIRVKNKESPIKLRISRSEYRIYFFLKVDFPTAEMKKILRKVFLGKFKWFSCGGYEKGDEFYTEEFGTLERLFEILKKKRKFKLEFYGFEIGDMEFLSPDEIVTKIIAEII